MVSQKFVFSNRAFTIGTQIVSLIILIATVVVAYSCSTTTKYSLGKYFGNTIKSVSDKYEVLLTPPSLTFSVWGVIYFLQFAWLLFCLIYTSVSKNCEVPIFPLTYVFYSVANLLTIGWSILWINEYLKASFGVLLAAHVLLIVAFDLSAQTFCGGKFVPSPVTEDCGIPKWVFLVSKYFVSNSIDFFVGWTMIAYLLNLAVMLEHSIMFSSDKATGITLLTLGNTIIIMFIIRYICYAKSLYFAFGVPIALIFGLSAILSSGGSDFTELTSGYFIIFLLSIVIFTFIYLVVLNILRLFPNLSLSQLFLKKSSTKKGDKKNNENILLAAGDR